MVLVGKIAYNFFTSSIGRVMGLFFSLSSIAFIARALGLEDFGQYSTILAFLFLFTGLADLGLYSLLLREISRPRADEKYILEQFFSLRLFSIILVLLFAILLIFFLPYPQSIKIGVGFSAIGFLFISLSQVLMPVFQKYLKTDKAAIAEVLGRMLQFILVILFFKMQLGLFWFLFASILSNFLTFFINFIFVRRYVLFSLKLDIQYFKKILSASWPIGLSIAFTMIYFKGNIILLSLLKTQEDVGIFNLGYRILENLLFFPAIFVGLMMPFLSDRAVSNLKEFQKFFQKTFDILAIGALPLIFGGFFLAPSIVMLLGGKEFISAVLPLQILLLATAMIFFGNLAASSIIALNQQKSLVWIYGLGALFSLTANFLLIPRYSYNGAALTTLLTELLVTILMFWTIFKVIRFLPSFRIFLKALVSCLIITLPLYYFYQPQPPLIFTLLLILTGFVYFTALYFLRGISKADIRLLIKSP